MAYLRVRLRLCRGKTGDLGTSEKECENKCSGKDILKEKAVDITGLKVMRTSGNACAPL